MENAQISPCCKENAGPPKPAMMQADPAIGKDNKEFNSPVISAVTPTGSLEESSVKNSDHLSPVTFKNIAPIAKTLSPGGRLEKPMPFRERNSEEGRRLLPPHIKVPPKKVFGYPERYRSPTDAMVSPVSRGLLTRNRRPARTLAPVVPPKALENTFQDVMVDVAARAIGST